MGEFILKIVNIKSRKKVRKIREDIAAIKQEWAILKAFDSPFILKQYGDWNEINYHKMRGRLYSVLEICERGELFDLLQEGETIPSPPLAKYYFASVVLGLEYAQTHCSESNSLFMHRDLKAENLLITRDGRLKMIDFDTSKIIQKGTKTNTMNGTNGYLSPEKYMYGEHDDTTDLWSMGILLYIFLNGHSVYDKIGDIIPPKLPRKLIQGTIERHLQHVMTVCPAGWGHLADHKEKCYTDLDKDGISHEARLAGDLIAKLLKFDPEQRLPLAGVKAHPYFKGFPWPAEGEPLPTPVELGIITEDVLNRIAPRKTASQCKTCRGTGHVCGVRCPKCTGAMRT